MKGVRVENLRVTESPPSAFGDRVRVLVRRSFIIGSVRLPLHAAQRIVVKLSDSTRTLLPTAFLMNFKMSTCSLSLLS